MSRETHWSYGGGSVGCLYDCGPSYAPSKAAAIDSLAQIYELTDAERETLERDCILYFDASQGSAVDEPGLMFSRRSEVGADYCELTEQDGPCPEEE